MVNQLTTNGDALRLFFTDEFYLVNESVGQLNEQIQLAAEGIEVEGIAAAVQSEIPVVNEPAATIMRTPETVIAAGVQVPEFKFLGSNKRNILILVNDEQHEVSDEKGRELLRKIVKSVNLTANDFALLNYSRHNGVSFTQLKDHFSSVIVFAFGVSTKQLGLAEHPENTVVAEGSVKLIFSAELKKLEEDQQGKKVLWGCLKQLGL